jgi:hypothetical protein
VTLVLLGRIRRPVKADAPVVLSVVRVAVTIPQKTNSVIYNDVCAGPTHNIS